MTRGRKRRETEDPMITTSFRCPKSWLDLLESRGLRIADYARAGVKAQVDVLLHGELNAIEEGIKECEAAMSEAALKKGILEKQKAHALERSLAAVEQEKKLNKFISEIQRLAPAIIDNHDGTARYKIEHLAGLSPGPGRADIARFFQGRRELPEVGEIREFLKIE